MRSAENNHSGFLFFLLASVAATVCLVHRTKKNQEKKESNTIHYAIVANGPFLPKSLIMEAIAGKKIIALDGAANKLAKIGVIPHVILGDFDSITEEGGKEIWGIHSTFNEIDDHSAEYSGNFGTQIVPAKNQDLTDLAKAIRYCDEHGAASIDILCVTEGRFDHTWGNMGTLRSEYRPDRRLRVFTATEVITFVKDSAIAITGTPEDYCGVVAFPAGRFSSRGLKYNGDHYPLELGFSESVCNQLSENAASITVEGEALVIAPSVLEKSAVFQRMPYDQVRTIVHEEQNVLLVLSTLSIFNRIRENASSKIEYVMSDQAAHFTDPPILLRVSKQAYNQLSLFNPGSADTSNCSTSSSIRSATR